MLSKCAIDTLYMRSGLDQFHIPDATREFTYDKCIYDFARAIEEDIRKQDDQVIRQLLEALKTCRIDMPGTHFKCMVYDGYLVTKTINSTQVRTGAEK